MNARRIALLLLLLSAPPVAAQTSRQPADEVEAIRRRYAELGERIALSEKGDEESSYTGLHANEVVLNRNGQMWPAVGNYRAVYRFYYEAGDDEEGPIPRRLVKVTIRTEASAHDALAEYMFDERGALSFVFRQSANGEEKRELRLYFARGRAIRVIKGSAVVDRLTAEDLALASDALETARKLETFFKSTLTLPDE